MTLTATEKRAFSSADKAAQVGRFPDEYLDGPADFDGDRVEFRARQLAKYAQRDAGHLRARANVLGVDGRGSPGQVIRWSPGNDYTPAEMQAIEDELRDGRGWDQQMAAITAAGPSVKQRLSALEGR